MSEVCLVRNLSDVMGISCWTTHDVKDCDTGVSGAGYESSLEAVEDSITEYESSTGLYVADCSAMRDKLLDLSDPELVALVDDIKVPVVDWLQMQRETGDKGTV